MRSGLISLFLVIATPSFAQAIYTWVDKSGAEHFTDDPTTIPKGAKIKQTDGDEISTVSTDTIPTPKPKVIKKAEGDIVAELDQRERDAEIRRQRAADKDAEQQWRQQFRDAKAKIADLEAEVEADRVRVEEVNGLPVSTQLNCGNSGYGGNIAVNGFTAPTYGTNGLTRGCWYGPSYEWERIKDRLATERRALVRAKDDLANLERRAANEAIPLEWRR